MYRDPESNPNLVSSGGAGTGERQGFLDDVGDDVPTAREREPARRFVSANCGTNARCGKSACYRTSRGWWR